MANQLEATDIGKLFGDFAAVQNVDFEISDGEFICILGPSGCGKTTLLRVIAGLETQSSGKIIQNGKDISLLPPDQRDFGIVFQSYALFPNLTVKNNIAFGLETRKYKKQDTDKKTVIFNKNFKIPNKFFISYTYRLYIQFIYTIYTYSIIQNFLFLKLSL